MGEGKHIMATIRHGQTLLIICFIIYMIWWYRGFRPAISISRVKGLNGLLLAITALTGIAGIILSLQAPAEPAVMKIQPIAILIIGVVGYIALLLVTGLMFKRSVTSELLLIVVWTMLEVYVITLLNSAGGLTDTRFGIMCGVIAVAFLGSMICYCLYYRLEEKAAFYTAMAPLVAGIVSMVVLLLMAR